MMIKFLAHGKGSATKAAAYLLAAHDHLGVVRAGVKTLRGNGEIFSALADSSGFSQRYTSGVIAWAASDAPTDEELEEVLDSFESLAFAGLSKKDYHFFAVLHDEDDGSRHIHVMAPRIHLGTKKSLNIAPPGHTKAFYAWRDLWNERMGWASPADPLRRRRVVVPPHEVRANKAKIAQGLQLERDPREFIAESIEAAVYAGKIKNRADVEDFLRKDFFADEENGRVSRVVRNSISVQLRREDGELEKPMRLTGAFFDHDFDADNWLGDEWLLRAGALDAQREPNADLLVQLAQEVEKHREKRAVYNQKRYTPKPSKEIKTKPKPTINLEVIYDGVADSAGESRKTRDRAAEMREDIDRTDARIRALRASVNRSDRRIEALRASISSADDRIRALRKSVGEQQQAIIVVTGSIREFEEQEQKRVIATKSVYEQHKMDILSAVNAQLSLLEERPIYCEAVRHDPDGFVRLALAEQLGRILDAGDSVVYLFLKNYQADLLREVDAIQQEYEIELSEMDRMSYRLSMRKLAATHCFDDDIQALELSRGQGVYERDV